MVAPPLSASLKGSKIAPRHKGLTQCCEVTICKGVGHMRDAVSGTWSSISCLEVLQLNVNYKKVRFIRMSLRIVIGKVQQRQAGGTRQVLQSPRSLFNDRTSHVPLVLFSCHLQVRCSKGNLQKGYHRVLTFASPSFLGLISLQNIIPAPKDSLILRGSSLLETNKSARDNRCQFAFF